MTLHLLFDAGRKTEIPITTMKHQIDWSKYEDVPFAVLGFSTQCGWMELRCPASPAEAHQAYEAQDYPRKYLLNYGQIVREN